VVFGADLRRSDDPEHEPVLVLGRNGDSKRRKAWTYQIVGQKLCLYMFLGVLKGQSTSETWNNPKIGSQPKGPAIA
jgi:hypothetical protein